MRDKQPRCGLVLLAPRRRAAAPEPCDGARSRQQSAFGGLQALLNRAAAAQVTVDRRPLSVYDQIAGTSPFTTARSYPKGTTS